MQTEILEVDSRFGAQYQGKYLFKEISWAKRNRIIQKYTKYNKLSGEVDNSDLISIQAETIMASLHAQPETHPITLDKLLSEDEGIPIGLGEIFSQIANRLNALDREDIRFLSDASDAKNLTQPSPTLDLVKNSVGPQQNSANNLPESSKSTQSSSTS